MVRVFTVTFVLAGLLFAEPLAQQVYGELARLFVCLERETIGGDLARDRTDGVDVHDTAFTHFHKHLVHVGPGSLKPRRARRR